MVQVTSSILLLPEGETACRILADITGKGASAAHLRGTD